MNFKDEIIASGGVDRFGQPITGNAEKTLHYGIEFSGQYSPLSYLRFTGNVSLSKNELKTYRYYESDPAFFEAANLDYKTQAGTEGTTYYADLDGRPIAGFPSMLANLRATYTWQNVYASMGLKYVGESYTDNFKIKDHKLDAYTVLNLAINYNLKSLGAPMLSLQGRINNLMDTNYLSYGEGIAFFPAAPRNYFVTLKVEL